MQPTLDKYLKALTRLKRGNTPMGIAPHKPVLLISIIELLEKGIITQNKVYINADLVGTFKENWQLLVNTLHRPIVHCVTSNDRERSPSPLALNQSLTER